MEILQKLHQILQFDSESQLLDYKKEQYPMGKVGKKSEILKDISAFANHPSNEDKFIIIGVKEENGIATEFNNIEDIIDQANYQQYLNENIEPQINFEYKSFEYRSYKLSYFRIFKNTSRPYLFKKDIIDASKQSGNFKIGDGFIRSGTSTRKLKLSDFDAIYSSKFEILDRSEDIEIIPVSHKRIVEFERRSSVYKQFLDLNVVNKSNKSIDLDVKMKVFTTEDLQLYSIGEFGKLQRLQDNPWANAFTITPTFHSFDVDFESDFESYTASTIRRPGNRIAISIPQNSTEEYIFEKGLLIKEYSTSQIVKAIVELRSDDFTNGLLTKEIQFEI